MSLRGVSRSFAGRPVLRDATIDAAAGEIVAILGPNGCGKTTVLRIAAGVLTPGAGSVEIAGGSPGNGASSLVPAGDRMLHWRLPARHEIDFYASLAGLDGPERDARVTAALQAVDAGSFADRPIGECSTGQRRRLMLAAGLVTSAPVLLIDEPYADLDGPGRAAVDRVCLGWCEGGGTVLYAAPDDGDGPGASRVYAIEDGAVRRTP